MTTKAGPICEEQILAATVKCKHCGSDFTPQSTVKNSHQTKYSTISSYLTTWGFLFESSPGYWRVQTNILGWLGRCIHLVYRDFSCWHCSVRFSVCGFAYQPC